MTYRALDKLTPDFRNKVDRFLTEATSIGIFITETWRSDADQLKEFQEGNSFLDGKKYKSMHQIGKAIDIAFLGDELYPDDLKKWQRVAAIAKKYGMQWGFDLWGWDKPHFQDNGVPLPETPKPEVSLWAKESVAKAKKKGIKVWTDPQEQVGTATLRAMFFKLGLVTREHGIITKEDAAVILDRSGLLD